MEGFVRQIFVLQHNAILHKYPSAILSFLCEKTKRNNITLTIFLQSVTT